MCDAGITLELKKALFCHKHQKPQQATWGTEYPPPGLHHSGAAMHNKTPQVWCGVVWCPILSCPVLSCRAVPCRAVSCCVVLYRDVPMPRRAMECPVVPRHTASRHVLSCRAVLRPPYVVMSCGVMACRTALRQAVPWCSPCSGALLQLFSLVLFCRATE